MAWYKQLHWQILLGMALGTLFGVVAAQNGWGQLTADWVAPFGTIFLNLLKLIAMPLVITSLICGVASLSDFKKLSRMGGKTIGLYLATTAVAVTIGLLADASPAWPKRPSWRRRVSRPRPLRMMPMAPGLLHAYWGSRRAALVAVRAERCGCDARSTGVPFSAAFHGQD